MTTTVHTLTQKTFKDILDITVDTKVCIPKTTGLTSRIYITIGEETVRAGSRAFLNDGIDVCIYELTENESIPHDCFVQIFQSGRYSVSSMVAIMGMHIGRLQDIKVKGCNTSN